MGPDKPHSKRFIHKSELRFRGNIQHNCGLFKFTRSKWSFVFEQCEQRIKPAQSWIQFVRVLKHTCENKHLITDIVNDGFWIDSLQRWLLLQFYFNYDDFSLKQSVNLYACITYFHWSGFRNPVPKGNLGLLFLLLAQIFFEIDNRVFLMSINLFISLWILSDFLVVIRVSP